MARRHKSLSLESAPQTPSLWEPVSWERAWIFAQWSLSHPVEAEWAGGAQGYVTPPGQTCQSLGPPRNLLPPEATCPYTTSWLSDKRSCELQSRLRVCMYD